MNVNEAVAMQTPEMAHAGGTPGATMPPEENITYQRADGTVEQATSREDAIARCPVLGKMPLKQAEILLELAAEGSEQLAKEAQNERTRTTAESEKDNDSASDLLKEDRDEATGEEAEEADMAQFDRENAAAQEEIQKRQQSLGNKLNARRKSVKSEENVNHVVDIGGIVHGVIVANPQACQDFRNGNTAALDILVKEAMKLSLYNPGR